MALQSSTRDGSHVRDESLDLAQHPTTLDNSNRNTPAQEEEMNRRSLELLGTMFETKVVLKLKEDFPDAVVLHNINSYSHTLKKETQTDVVVVSKGGIFVIESKNFITSMKGSYGDKYWELRSRDKKAKFVFNTLGQNMLHTRSLNAAMYRKFGEMPMHLWNLIVFPDSTYLNTDVKEVCNFSGLTNKIKERMNENLGLDVYKYASMLRRIDSDELKRQEEIYGLLDERVTHFKAREE